MQDFPVLGFGGAAIGRRPSLERADQFRTYLSHRQLCHLDAFNDVAFIDYNKIVRHCRQGKTNVGNFSIAPRLARAGRGAILRAIGHIRSDAIRGVAEGAARSKGLNS